METKDLEKFDPTVAELTAMVEVTKNITATDLKDKEQMAVVRENRITLKNARVRITKIGKELREDALNFQKAVIAKEKELIGIIEPEEARLADIEEQARLQAVREERLEKLPARKERLDQIEASYTDEQLLDMDSEQFEAFFNQKMSEHNENVRIQNEKIQKELQDKIDAENARIQEEQRAEQERILAEQKEAQDKLDADRKALEEEKERIEAERLKLEKEKADEKARVEQEKKDKAEEAERLEKRNAFIEFRASFGWTEETKGDYKVDETDEGYVLYKKLGVFAK